MTSEPEKLLPCPFCGGEAKRFTIEEEGDNFGGDVIACTGVCGASSHVEFGRKENLVSLWNTRLSSPVSGTDMVPWEGGDGPPSDWDGGPVRLRCGDIEPAHLLEDADWQIGYPENGFKPSQVDVVAYTRKAIPVIAEVGERERIIEQCAQAVEGLRREVPYEYNSHPCATTMRRAASAIRALSTPATLDNTAVEVETLREALAAEDDYWAASRAHASALPRLREATGAVFAAASDRRDRARAAVATLTAKTEKAE